MLQKISEGSFAVVGAILSEILMVLGVFGLLVVLGVAMVFGMLMTVGGF